MQLLLTIIFYIWLFAALALWLVMWRYNVTRTEKMQQTLIEVAEKNADTAMVAAEAARRLTELWKASGGEEKKL